MWKTFPDYICYWCYHYDDNTHTHTDKIKPKTTKTDHNTLIETTQRKKHFPFDYFSIYLWHCGVPVHTCEGWRASGKSWFSLSIMQAPGIKLRSWRGGREGPACIFTHQPSLQSQGFILAPSLKGSSWSSLDPVPLGRTSR